MTPIRFSVLLPTKDRRELLIGAIATVQRQTYDHWELVVADNCSSDDVAAYVRSLKEPRIVYTRSDVPLPVTANWNRALDAASGDYVVMLGDDDGLIPGYFERCLAALDEVGTPEFLYHGAYHFAFPGVFPQYPDGYLRDVSWFRNVLCHGSRAILLPREEARSAAQMALNMTAAYGFNMQHFLFGRAFLRKMGAHGPVFRGPFPDFYAANLAMLLAERIGLVPEPLVIIGISPKSYGFFHFNNREAEGASFLDNEACMDAVPTALRERLLPGSYMNTAWLVSVALIEETLQHRADVRPAVRRYRTLQINRLLCDALLRQGSGIPMSGAWNRLGLDEKVYALALSLVLAPLRMFPHALRRKVAGVIDHLGKQYLPPRRPVRHIAGVRANDILDVFQILANEGQTRSRD
ncbi:MAG: glycosyltransferase [Gammaproteobacteria bacterium]